MVKKILGVTYHRNGICGEPFHLVLFDSTEGEKTLLGILPASTGEQGRCFVLEPAAISTDLAARKIEACAFGAGSFRGDNFERELRQAVSAWEKKEHERFDAYPAGFVGTETAPA